MGASPQNKRRKNAGGAPVPVPPLDPHAAEAEAATLDVEEAPPPEAEPAPEPAPAPEPFPYTAEDAERDVRDLARGALTLAAWVRARRRPRPLDQGSIQRRAERIARTAAPRVLGRVPHDLLFWGGLVADFAAETLEDAIRDLVERSHAPRTVDGQIVSAPAAGGAR